MIYLIGMELTSINDIKNICQRLEISPTKDRGQNFLVNSEVVDRMVELAEVSRKDEVLEIGPGLGILTQRLVARAGRVVAVELDGKLYEYLSERFKGIKNLELVKADGLKWLEAGGVGRRDYKVVANLPYQISSRILRLNSFHIYRERKFFWVSFIRFRNSKHLIFLGIVQDVLIFPNF